MNIQHKIINRTLFASISGELDEHTAPLARELLDKAIMYNKFDKLIIQLSQLIFMDSTGIGVLLGRYKKAKQIGATTFIQQPSRQADRVLSLSGIYSLMPKLD